MAHLQELVQVQPCIIVCHDTADEAVQSSDTDSGVLSVGERDSNSCSGDSTPDLLTPSGEQDVVIERFTVNASGDMKFREMTAALSKSTFQVISKFTALENLTDCYKSYSVRVLSPPLEPLELEVNHAELVEEVRQVLMDRAESCMRTCFSLEFGGKILDNYVEFGTIEGVKDGITLRVVEDPYNLRTAKLHLRHIRDLMKPLNCYDDQSASPTVVTSIIESARRMKPDRAGYKAPDYIIPDYPGSIPIVHLVPLEEESPAKCLKYLNLSQWNPPPGNRKLHGDILYLQVLTLENKHFDITCCTRGFYVNQSTEEAFKPIHVNKAVYHSLVELLNNLSPSFKKNFAQLQRKRCDKHVFERLTTPYQVFTWAAPEVAHSVDFIRSEDILNLKLGYEDNVPGQSRCWNEEFQLVRELPRTTVEERAMRERTLLKIHSDFVYAALRGAVAVVEGSIMPINPDDDRKQQVYLWNNLIMLFAYDVKDQYKTLGGDAAAHAAPLSDLHGLRAYCELDIENLHIVETAVIDYRGYRVTVQSIIPGVMEREQEESVVYGSLDFGKTVSCDEKFQALLELSAKDLRILPHAVLSSDGKEVQMYTSVECKGIIGNDGRHYILDLLRTFPPDVNYLFNSDAELDASVNTAEGYPRRHLHDFASIRQKLVDDFVNTRYEKFVRLTAYYFQKPEFLQLFSDISDSNILCDRLSLSDSGAEEQSKTIIATLSDEPHQDDLPDAEVAKDIMKATLSLVSTDKMNEFTGEVIKKAANAVGSCSETEFDMRFNPDCFCTTVTHKDNEHLVKQRRMVCEVAKFLLNEQIPKFVSDAVVRGITIVDGSDLVEALHEKGINVRYLGKIIELLDSKPTLEYLKTICITELICRSAKHVLRPYLQNVDQMNIAAALSHFLNCFLSCQSTAQVNTDITNQARKQKKNKKGSPNATPSRPSSVEDNESWSKLTSASLWRDIVSDMDSYYGYQLTIDADKFHEYGIPKICVLRRFSLSMGIQLVMRDYNLDQKGKPTFSPKDIGNMFPLVKHLNLKAKDALECYRKAQAKLEEGQFKAAFNIVNEANNHFASAYGGPLHADVGKCMHLLGRVAYLLGNIELALEQQQKATIISERCNGLDHPRTVLEYTTLALYYFVLQQPIVALHLLYRTRYLLLIMNGGNHPQLSVIDTNIGIVLTVFGDFTSAQRYFENALQLNLRHLGPEHLSVALTSHLLGLLYMYLGDYRSALRYEKQTFSIYKKTLGEDHVKTFEAAEQLKELTQEAVNFQKQIKLASSNKDEHMRQRLPLQLNLPHLLSFSTALEFLNIVNGIVELSAWQH